jgi:hypothetical protein
MTGAQSYMSHAFGRLGSFKASKAGERRWQNAVLMTTPLPKYSAGRKSS